MRRLLSLRCYTLVSVGNWQELIPKRLGDMPLGGDLTRTDAGGPVDAPIAVLGVYPAAVRWERFKGPDGWMKLPVKVEKTSFDPASESGCELDEAYLDELGLSRDHVFLFDMMPYFMANTRRYPGRPRSMWDNVQIYEQATGTKTAVRGRMLPDELIAESRSMPGNLDRLREYLGAAPRKLLITLGNEGAAFARGQTVARAAQRHLFGAPTELDVLGVVLPVVHLPHPGAVMVPDSRWGNALAKWTRETGRALATKAAARLTAKQRRS